MTILLSDPRVSALEVCPTHDSEPLVRLDASLAPSGQWVRRSLADRLATARGWLPDGLDLLVVEGHRSPQAQQRIISTYRSFLLSVDPTVDPLELTRRSSRFVAPIEVAPHVAGAAVDLTLVDGHGRPLDLGTRIDATPEESGGRCYFAARDIAPAARRNRDRLAEVLTAAGLVNYPTEWWHWSYGDRYWALMTAQPAALFGPVRAGVRR